MSATPAPDLIPADFRRALRQSDLDAFFIECAYVHRAGYLGWIRDAARPQTRRKRIRQSVMRLLEQRSAVLAEAQGGGTGGLGHSHRHERIEAMPPPVALRRCS